eukprot:CAMPEP_0172358216 /NCGR_PEP_ID=MMETSP1060-20121228/2543_1 /TAXON_ID=37318 /ORGANISM="Pseudo-nitzschia pungens, Strain cf. cingulata" /LENGTH=297 /DNA_ID=CAMNT_0013079315 /DNA_START=57 /DNA_END=947 /DNA_ORIENTATION=+
MSAAQSEEPVVDIEAKAPESSAEEDFDPESSAEEGGKNVQFAVEGAVEGAVDGAVDGAVEKSSIKRGMERMESRRTMIKNAKRLDHFDLEQDVYALVFVANVYSWAFWYGMYVIFLKYTVYGILLSDIHYTLDFNVNNDLTTAAKFFLIPVAIAMQDDLIYTYWHHSNALYGEKSCLELKWATQRKLTLSNCLKLIDGILSLSVNYGVMLTTDNTLGVFLNFAALGFLQDIDNAFYKLLQMGFFGDEMEILTVQIAGIEFDRRVQETNRVFCGIRHSHLDTCLLVFTFVVCIVAYIW